MRQFLSDHRDWVIDGNYLGAAMRKEWSKPTRLSFNFSRWNCLYRGWKRYRRYKDRVRESMAEGCPERFDLGIHPLDSLGRTNKTARERYQNIHSTYPEKFISLKNQKELDAFLKTYNKKG